MTNQTDHLNSLKEIAAYLGCSTRTIQRWEKERGLPVRRLPGERGGVYAVRAELDAWKLSDSAAGSDQEIQSERATAKPARATQWPLIGGAVALTAVLVFVVWSRSSSGTATGRPPADSLVGGTSRSPGGLNDGPWPILGQNSARTHRSPLDGPTTASPPQLVFDFGAKIGDLGGFVRDEIVVGKSGRLYLGGCGRLQAVAATGESAWSMALTPGEGVTGLALDVQERLISGIHDCPDDIHTRRIHVLSVFNDGTPAWSFLQPGTTFGPAVDAEGSIYVVDEFGALRAYSAIGAPQWVTTLGGYSFGALAIDREGTIYAATDASRFGHKSLWAIDRDGHIKWNTGEGSLLTPAIGDNGVIYVPDQGGTLRAFTAAGAELWSRSVGPFGREAMLAIATDGTIYVRTLTTLIAMGADGVEHWRIGVDGGEAAATAPAIDRAGTVYIVTASAVEARTPKGDLAWSTSIETPNRVIIGGDGVLYVVSASRRVYAIRSAAAGMTAHQGPAGIARYFR